MRRLLLVLALGMTLPARPAAAAEATVLRLDFPKRDWPDTAGDGETRPAVTQKAAGGRCEVVCDAEGGRQDLTLWQSDDPPVGHDAFAVVGHVAHRGLSPTATLRMVVEYPDGTRDDMRAASGNNGLFGGGGGGGGFFGGRVPLEGTAAAHDFRFDYPGQPDAVPRRLTLLLTFAGTGVVTITDAALVRVTPDPPATAPASSPDGPMAVALTDLPPAVAAAVRAQFEEDLIRTINERQSFAEQLDAETRSDPRNATLVRQWQASVAAADRKIDQLRAVLARPTPTTRPADDAAAAVRPLRLLRWLESHFVAVFLTLIGLILAAAILMRRLAVRGRGRPLVTGVFGLILAGGLLQIFAAGLAMGLGLPAFTWATLLGCAALMTGVPAVTLPHVRRQYADAELRRMRAMDVPA